MSDPFDRRYLTATHALPPVRAGFIKGPETFQVEEVPLYEPVGEGQHTYLKVEKRGIDTREATRRLARAFGCRPKQLGVAGLKDAHAVTIQTVSVPDLDPEAALAFRDESVTVLSATRHRNKLRIGHLKGNRFRIRLEGADAADAERACEGLALLGARGLPNYFGNQRFGVRRNNHLVGRALLLADHREALAELCGRPRPMETPAIAAARQAFDEGRLQEAQHLFPRFLSAEHRAVAALLKAPDDPARAVRAVPRRLRRFLVDAYQSALFNHLLTRRFPQPGQLLEGDVAMLHQGGACFVVTDPGSEQPRVAAGEITPAGPLFGPRLLEASGEPGRQEAALLEQEGLPLDRWEQGDLQPRGVRRPYLQPLLVEEVSLVGEQLQLRFQLPPGTYATRVIAELRQQEVGDASTAAPG